MLAEFQRYQFAFAAHIRDPRAHRRPAGVEARRMKIYRDLLYTNLENALQRCFPVLRATLGARSWRRIVRAFFRLHRCRTPYFRHIPDEFMAFLQGGEAPLADAPPWLFALAHYEWIELALSISNAACTEAFDASGNLLEGVPLLNPVLANLHYEWPVHRIAPRRKIAPEATHLLVFRDAEDIVRFSQINAFTARLLTLLADGDLTGRAALARIASESRHPDPAVILQAGTALLDDLGQRGAILGARRG